MTRVQVGQVLGVVLAGGRSSRMGRDKCLLEHPGGGSYLRFAVDRLLRLVESTLIVGGEADLPDVLTIPDPIMHQGPAIGLAAALSHADRHDFAACLVTPVDVPLLTADDLRRLMDVWHGDPQRIVCATERSGVSGRPRLQPLVAIYPRFFGPAIAGVAESQDRSLSRYLQSVGPVTIELPSARLRNVNRPEDVPQVRLSR